MGQVFSSINLNFLLLQNPSQRSSSAKEERPKPAFGRKQFAKNLPSSGAPRSKLGSYSQSHGTIKASALSSITAGKW